MNKAISLAFTFAILCLLATQTTAVDVCQRSELGSLLTNKNTTLCASESGVVFADLQGAPSDDQLTDICETDSCRSLIAAILAINPEDCTLPLNENLQLMSELVHPVVEHCTAMGIEINGSSLVGSGSDVDVGDDSQASGSAGSGASAFRRHIGRAARAAAGVLLAGVIQTGSTTSSDGSTKFLPSFYYLGGLAYAATMVIYASAPTVGGVVQQVWQIDLGVGLALLYNFGVFSWIPITQGNLVSVPENLNNALYYVSLHDWSVVSPFMFVFTFAMLLLPLQSNVKMFALSSNIFFMLEFVDPLNPKGTGLKDLSSSDYSTRGLLLNLAVYCIVGVVGTLISLATVLFPTPLFATKKLMHHMDHSPNDIRQILNLIMDSYCFRAKDIKKMDFFKLRLDRLLAASQRRLSEMENLLEDSWWEAFLGVGLWYPFNRNVAKQFVKLYGRLLKDLRAMKFAMETETGHWTHVVLMKRMQQSIYIMQREANDLLHEIADIVLEGSPTIQTSKFASLETSLDVFMKKYAKLYGAMLSADVHTTDDVGKTMSLNVFIYSFHAFVHTLLRFEDRFKRKKLSCGYRIGKILGMIWLSVYEGTIYMRRKAMFAVRTTLAVMIAYCASSFVFAFSSTAPTAVAMVAQFQVGGTYGKMKKRMAGLVAGTVVPSIMHFFICKLHSVELYNGINNAVLFVWIVGSMYACFSSSHLQMAGMVSAYMAASVLLDHTCRTAETPISYSTLTENSVAILILILVEACIFPKSARGLLRSNIQRVLGTYGVSFHRLFEHHIASGKLTATPIIGRLRSVAEIESIPGAQATATIKKSEVKNLRKQFATILPTILKQQKKLVHDATAEPNLWKTKFSREQYMQVVNVCWALLDQLRLLSDLIEWREKSYKKKFFDGIRLKRRSAGNLNDECTAAFQEQKKEEEAQRSAALYLSGPDSFNMSDPPKPLLPPLAPNAPSSAAKAKWDRSQGAFETVVEETLDALVTIFSKDFTYRSADDYAIFLQMKEAFRIADKNHTGTVDSSELAVLLEKLMPYTVGQGNIHMEQYVDEFMRLVDKNCNGEISFDDFMRALNDGFRLELTILENSAQLSANTVGSGDLTKKPTVPQHAYSMDVSDDSSVDVLEASNITNNSLSRPPATPMGFPPNTLSRHGRNELGGGGDDSVSTSGSSDQRRWWSENQTESARVTLLNVESFSLNETAATLKQSYGELLLRSLNDNDQYVTMEDFIVMSCFISSCEDIARKLTRLSVLAAS
ncbi:hypothetical protein PHYBOEH_001142 [Phytophthora boehmeriae]|uniref:EF-hand domain-containing protein n=1 Tax=Phytophthora boehmeriae TaxID=109152 RepID=A0A8T1WZP0_9STRA|nr:hypothetical protein PHYBOEH_001142 [Phytophthora boehmeriae]